MEVIGYIAGLLTLVGYLPQTIKTIRTRRTKDLALATFIIIGLAALLWTVFGIANNMPAVWMTNMVVGICSTIIICIKLSAERL
ncbi:MAG: PQ-loop domain-containing transporter [Patescibacteria group bacterium]